MASRAIFRRKKLISRYVNAPPASVQSLQSLQSLLRGHTLQELDSRSYSPSADMSLAGLSPSTDQSSIPVVEGKPNTYPGFGHFSRSYGIAMRGLDRRQDVDISSLGLRGMFCSVRTVSTSAVASQQDTGSDDEENENLIDGKKKKEPSPEDCDEAVAGLSSARAKAKAKKSLSPPKEAKSVLHRVWATLLGIGPALRAVASMSRFGCFVDIMYFLSCDYLLNRV